MSDGAKVLFLDIETSPILMTSWSIRSPEASAVWVERDTFILMFSYQWMGDKKVRTVCLPDFPGYKRDKYNDKKLCSVLHELLDKADIVCAHNAQFDVKKTNSRLIINGFDPPSPYKIVDTLKIARGAFKFDSAKLDSIGRYLSLGRKIPNTGAHLWRGCVDGNLDAWRIMRMYCKQDTALLAKAYDKLKAWAPNHPDMRLYREKRHSVDGSCPVCESENVTRRGFIVKLKTKVQRFQCQECASWFSGGRINEQDR
jgi:hypothetical protein